MPPTVSLVIPAYNAARTVGAAVSSALCQTVADLEVVVVDDGSTDGTAAIAHAFGAPVRVVEQGNEGVAAARNHGIEVARAPLVTLLDADDFLFDDHVRSLLAVHGQSGGIVTANAWWLFPGGISPGRTRHRGTFPPPVHQRMAILEQNFVSPMSVFPKAMWERISGFDATLRRAEDWDFWMRAIYAGERVRHQPKPTALYRWSIAGLTAAREQMDEAVEHVLRKARAQLPLKPEEGRYVDRRLVEGSPAALLRRGDALLRSGRYRQAADCYARAAALAPSDRTLARSAAALRVAPWAAGPLLRRRQQQRVRLLDR